MDQSRCTHFAGVGVADTAAVTGDRNSLAAVEVPSNQVDSQGNHPVADPEISAALGSPLAASAAGQMSAPMGQVVEVPIVAQEVPPPE